MEVCGGLSNYATLCDTWSPETGLWTRSQTSLNYNRQNHVSWLSAEGLVLLGGSGSLSTSEILSNETTSEAYFELKYTTRLVCYRDDNNNIFLIDGHAPSPTMQGMRFSSLVATVKLRTKSRDTGRTDSCRIYRLLGREDTSTDVADITREHSLYGLQLLTAFLQI